MRYVFAPLHYPVGYYELNPLPGANQIVVSNHATVLPQYRGKGFGRAMADARLIEAEKAGYDYMLATVRADNAPQLALMREWTQLDAFHNRESGNDVLIYGRSLA